MMNNELVTVIVPYYRHEKYIKECITSIVTQSYKNIELIVIDDGSPDDGWKLITELAEKHNFLFIRKSNEGLCKTLNLGLKLAKGKYFCAVGSDDVLFKYKLEHQIEFLKKEQISVCSAGAVCGTSFDNSIEKATENSMKYKLCSYKDLLFFRGDVFAVNLFWATSLLKELGGYDESTKLEDLYILLKYTSLYGSIKSLTCDLAFYRTHGANLSADRHLIFEERMLLIKSVDFIKNKQQVLAVNQVLIYLFSKKPFKFIMGMPKVVTSGGSFQLLRSLKYKLMGYLGRRCS